MNAKRPELTHIFKYRSRFGVDERDEVVAFCGYREECSGSGRHSLQVVDTAYNPNLLADTCPSCLSKMLLEEDFNY